MSSINFFNEDVDIHISHQAFVTTWISDIIQNHDHDLIALNYIICSDNYLLEVNRTYLSHDYLTDIITFDNSDERNSIEADIFISIDRVRENAQAVNESFDREFHRVLIHGVLHLLGWNDKTPEQKQLMREKEEACLSLLPNFK